MVQSGVGPQPAGGAAASVAEPARPRGLERLGRFAARRRWVVLAVWILVVVVLGGFASSTGKPFRDVFTIPGTDSQAAVDVLAKRFPSENLPTAQVVLHDGTGALSTATVSSAATTIGKLPQVQSVGSPRVSTNGHTALLTVTYDVELADISLQTVDRLESATAPAARAGR